MSDNPSQLTQGLLSLNWDFGSNRSKIEPLVMMIRCITTQIDYGKSGDVHLHINNDVVTFNAKGSPDPAQFAIQFCIRDQRLLTRILECERMKLEINLVGAASKQFIVVHDLLTDAPMQVTGTPRPEGQFVSSRGGFPASRFEGNTAPYLFPEPLDTPVVRFTHQLDGEFAQSSILRPFLQYVLIGDEIHGPGHARLIRHVTPVSVVRWINPNDVNKCPNRSTYDFGFQLYRIGDVDTTPMPPSNIEHLLKSRYKFKRVDNGMMCDIDLRQKIYSMGNHIAAKTYCGALYACCIGDAGILSEKQQWKLGLSELFVTNQSMRDLINIWNSIWLENDENDQIEPVVPLELGDDQLLYNAKCEELYAYIQTAPDLSERLNILVYLYVGYAQSITEMGKDISQTLEKIEFPRQREVVYVASEREQGRLLYAAHPQIPTYGCAMIASAVCAAYDEEYDISKQDQPVSPPLIYSKVVCLIGISRFNEMFKDKGARWTWMGGPFINKKKESTSDIVKLVGLVKMGMLPADTKFIGFNRVAQNSLGTYPMQAKRLFFTLPLPGEEHVIGVMEDCTAGGSPQFYVIADGEERPAIERTAHRTIGARIPPPGTGRYYVLVDEARRTGSTYAWRSGQLGGQTAVSHKDIDLVIGG